MEKVLHRSILRRNQLLRKQRKNDLLQLRIGWHKFNVERNEREKALYNLVKNERAHRREDWILGPLAPNRNSGFAKGRYGSVPSSLSQGVSLPDRYIKGPKGSGDDAEGSETVYGNKMEAEIEEEQLREWYGEGSEGNIVEGDRVVVIRGRKGVVGMISEVVRVVRDTGSVIIKNVNTADVRLPPMFLTEKERTFARELPVPIKDVRLVIRLADEEQGTDRDYIIEHMYGGAPHLQRPPGSHIPRHTRYIAGTDEILPWPKDMKNRPPDYESDTTSFRSEEVTYTMQLLQAPLAPGVIDELRSKHAREMKTAIDDTAWMQKRVIEDAREDWLTSRTLNTPTADMQLARRAAGLQQRAALERRMSDNEVRHGVPMDRGLYSLISNFQQTKLRDGTIAKVLPPMADRLVEELS